MLQTVHLHRKPQGVRYLKLAKDPKEDAIYKNATATAAASIENVMSHTVYMLKKQQKPSRRFDQDEERAAALKTARAAADAEAEHANDVAPPLRVGAEIRGKKRPFDDSDDSDDSDEDVAPPLRVGLEIRGKKRPFDDEDGFKTLSRDLTPFLQTTTPVVSGDIVATPNYYFGEPGQREAFHIGRVLPCKPHDSSVSLSVFDVKHGIMMPSADKIFAFRKSVFRLSSKKLAYGKGYMLLETPTDVLARAMPAGELQKLLVAARREGEPEAHNKKSRPMSVYDMRDNFNAAFAKAAASSGGAGKAIVLDARGTRSCQALINHGFKTWDVYIPNCSMAETVWIRQTKKSNVYCMSLWDFLHDPIIKKRLHYNVTAVFLDFACTFNADAKADVSRLFTCGMLADEGGTFAITMMHSLDEADARTHINIASMSGGFTVVPIERIVTRGMLFMLFSFTRRTKTSLLVIAGSNVKAYDVMSARWTDLPPMPGTQQGAAGATLNGQVYFAGGKRGGAQLSEVVRFDVPTNTWAAVAPMATARSSAAAAFPNGLLYVAGGYGVDYSDLSSLERYSPASKAWQSGASMANARSSHQLVAMGGDSGALYAIGGYAGNGPTNSVERFDPATNTWAAVASMGTARYGHAAAVMGGDSGALYVAGGYGNGSTKLSSCERYDPVAKTWGEIADLPEPRSWLALACLRGSLYAVGGTDADGDDSQSPPWRYDVSTNTWVVAPLAAGTPKRIGSQACWSAL